MSSLTENYFFIADTIDVLGYLRVDGEEMANLNANGQVSQFFRIVW